MSASARSRTDPISFSARRWRALISASFAPEDSSSASSFSSSLKRRSISRVALALELGDLLAELALEGGQVLVATFVVDPRDEVGGKVDDLLELLGLELLTRLGAHEQVGEPAARPRRYQMWTTGAASSMWPMRSRRTFERVTSTPQRSQMIPRNRTRLYFPQ